jgi:hypothetical protein
VVVVYDWSQVIHKGVRTADGNPVGNIAAEDGDAITVLAPRSRVYSIPKSSVQKFDGSEVRISLNLADLRNYAK